MDQGGNNVGGAVKLPPPFCGIVVQGLDHARYGITLCRLALGGVLWQLARV